MGAPPARRAGGQTDERGHDSQHTTTTTSRSSAAIPVCRLTPTTTDGKSLTDLVEQPAKVMRIGTMIKQLLEEVRAAPLDDASRNRLRDIHRHQHPRARGRAGARAARRARAPHAAVHRGRHPVRRRAADRPGPAGRLAGRLVPRHPDRAVRPADGRAPAAGADAGPGRVAPRRVRGRRGSAAGTGQYL